MTRLAALLLLAAFAAEASAQPEDAATPRVEWPSWGGDPGSMHYSPLTRINRENVAGLELAWEWDNRRGAAPRAAAPGA